MESVPLDEQKQNVTQNHPLEYPSFSLTLQTVVLQSFATSYYCFEALGLSFPRISTVKPTVTTFFCVFYMQIHLVKPREEEMEGTYKLFQYAVCNLASCGL